MIDLASEKRGVNSGKAEHGQDHGLEMPVWGYTSAEGPNRRFRVRKKKVSKDGGVSNRGGKKMSDQRCSNKRGQICKRCSQIKEKSHRGKSDCRGWGKEVEAKNIPARGKPWA